MATYAEIRQAAENETLRIKVSVACIVAAELVRVEAAATPNHVNRLLWAKSAYVNPEETTRRMLWATLAQNTSATFAQIIGATDAVVQTAVNNAIDVFANGS